LKVLYDTNIVLDVLLKREPFADVAIELISAVENKIIQGYLCATTLTTIDYLITKANGKNSAKKTIIHLLQLFEVAAVNKATIDIAVYSDFSDFEDAVLYYSGACAGVDAFVTRNIKDFKAAKLKIYSTAELLEIIQKIAKS